MERTMKTTLDQADINRREAMKRGIGAATLVAMSSGAAPVAATTASVVITTETAQAQPTIAGGLAQPATGVNMQLDYARTIAATAYVWGWPMVNMLNRNAKITQAPRPGLVGGILPAAPRGQVGMLHDYIEPSETFRHVSQSGRRLWLRVLLARRGAGGRAGAEFRQSLLGLRAVRRPHRSFWPRWQTIQYETRFLSAGRSEVERQNAFRDL